MRVIAKKTLREFWDRYTDSEQALKSWYNEASRASWSNPNEVRRDFNGASILKNNRVVFNICGNRYRLITEINYQRFWVFIRFIGTHKDYDKVDANTV